MKKIDVDIEKSASAYLANPSMAAITDKKLTRKMMVFPRDVHTIVKEISFRRHISVREYVTEVLSAAMAACVDYRYECRFRHPRRDSEVCTSIFLPDEVAEWLRCTAHYSAVSEKDLIEDIIVGSFSGYEGFLTEKMKNNITKYGGEVL